MTIKILASVLIISSLLFGSVEIWSSTLVLFLVYSMGLFWCMRGGHLRFELPKKEKMLLLFASLFFSYALLQLVPIPGSVLAWLSPSAYKIYNFYAVRSAPLSLSLYPYGTAVESMKIAAFVIVFSIALINFKDDRSVAIFIKIVVVFSFSLAVFAILQKATWNGNIYWFRPLSQGGTPFGPFVNRNHFAGFMNMIIPLGLGLALTSSTREKGILYGFLTVIMAVSLFLSLSRGGIISFFGGIALFSLLMSGKRDPQRRTWLIGFFVIVVIGYVLYLGADQVIQRFYDTDIKSEQRLLVASYSLGAVKDFILTGSGLGTFVNVFPLYSPPLRQIFDHAHNDYIEFMLEGGVAGLLLLLGFLTIYIYCQVTSDASGEKRTLRIAATCSVATMLIHSVFDFNLHILSNALLFSAVLGLSTALAGSPKAGCKNESPETGGEKRTHLNTVKGLSRAGGPSPEEWEEEPRRA